MAISSTNSSSGSGVGSGSFNFDGVVSGLNTTSIINSLMKLDQAPITQLKNQQSKLQSRDTAYQAVEANVTSFQAALQTLLIPSNVNAKAVASSDTSIATAKATSSAANGTYTLSVDHLATATSVSSSIFNAGTWVSAGIGGGLKAGTEPGGPIALANAGFAITPSAGTFTINGAQIT